MLFVGGLKVCISATFPNEFCPVTEIDIGLLPLSATIPYENLPFDDQFATISLHGMQFCCNFM